MGTKRKLSIYRIIGSMLFILGIMGYLIVGDELRHVGEFLSVSCILVSGIVFLLIDFNLTLFKKLAVQWVAICLLACIPLGGIILDNLPVGICIGFVVGVALAITLGKSNKTTSASSPFKKTL